MTYATDAGASLGGLTVNNEGRRRVGARRFPVWWVDCVDWGSEPDEGDKVADPRHPDLRHLKVSDPEDIARHYGYKRRRNPWK